MSSLLCQDRRWPRGLCVLLIGFSCAIAGADDLVLPVPSTAELVSEVSDSGQFDLLLSAAERIRRDVVIDRKQPVRGEQNELIVELVRSENLNALADQFATALDVVLFRCSGRDCGRSNVWANEIIGNPILYGPDRHQRYVAGVIGDGEQQHLVSVYLVQRGNLRKYLRLQHIRPDEPVAFDSVSAVRDALLAEGLAILPRQRPGSDGELSAAAIATLTELAAELVGTANEPVYVVCHIYASAGSSEALRASQACADQAVDAMNAVMTSADAVPFVGFGAGSLLPRAERTHNRLELVLPGRLQRD